MGHNGRVKWIAAGAVLSLTLAFGACGGGGEEDDLPQAQALLAEAESAAKALRSFHFRLQHENGTTPAPMGLELVSAEGDAIPPDRLKAELRAKAPGFGSVTLNIIGIGEETWITNPFTRRWQKLPGATVRDIADPALIVNAVLQGLSEAKVVKRADIDGTETYQIAGRLSSDALQVAMPSAERGRTVSVEVWVGVDDALARRARIVGPLAAGEAADIVRQVDLSRFDADVEIEPPE